MHFNVSFRSSPSFFRKLAIILAMFLLSIFFVIYLFFGNSSPSLFRAEELSTFFHAENQMISPIFSTVYSPKTQFLKLSDYHPTDTINVYQILNARKEIDVDELKLFLDLPIHQICDRIHVKPPEYEIKRTTSKLGDSFEVYFKEDGEYLFSAYQNGFVNQLTFSKINVNSPILINNQAIAIDQTNSNDEIADSLDWLKSEFSQAFGVNFSDYKVTRDFGISNQNGAEWIRVHFYNKSEHELNLTQDVPISDHITVTFDNYPNHSSDLVSNTVLSVASVSFTKTRVDLTENWQIYKTESLLDLNQANELIKKGFCFGGHICKNCVSKEELKKWLQYDAYEIEYISGQIEQKTLLVPFYVFYRNVSTFGSDMNSYMKFYVPAISVSECKEYFREQEAYHQEK